MDFHTKNSGARQDELRRIADSIFSIWRTYARLVVYLCQDAIIPCIKVATCVLLVSLCVPRIVIARRRSFGTETLQVY